MNATLETTTQYVEFPTWQSVRKLANEIGVNFFSAQSSTFELSRGMGLQWDKYNNKRIDVRGWVKTYGDNEYMHNTVSKLVQENFILKLELWASKNNCEIVYTKQPSGVWASDYIQIVKKA